MIIRDGTARLIEKHPKMRVEFVGIRAWWHVEQVRCVVGLIVLMTEGVKGAVLNCPCDALPETNRSVIRRAKANGEVDASKTSEAVPGQKDPTIIVISGITENEAQDSLILVAPVRNLLGHIPGR